MPEFFFNCKIVICYYIEKKMLMLYKLLLAVFLWGQRLKCPDYSKNYIMVMRYKNRCAKNTMYLRREIFLLIKLFQSYLSYKLHNNYKKNSRFLHQSKILEYTGHIAVMYLYAQIIIYNNVLATKINCLFTRNLYMFYNIFLKKNDKAYKYNLL